MLSAEGASNASGFPALARQRPSGASVRMLAEALKSKVERITDAEELRRLCRYGYREASSLDEMEDAIAKALDRG